MRSLHIATREGGPDPCNERKSMQPPRPSTAKTKPIKLFLIKEEERKKAPEKPLPTKGSPKQLFSDPVPDALETKIYIRFSLEPLICTVGLWRVAACRPIRQSSVSLPQEHRGT